MEELFAELYAEFGAEPPERDEEADRLASAAMLAEAEFNLYQRKKELRNIIELCKKN
jgi:hypothetical protein